MLSDLRLAVRTLLKSPGFTAIAVLTLALGIGLSTSAFSLTNLLLFRNLPYPDSDRLVRVFGTSPQAENLGIAPGNALDIRSATTSFSGFALYTGNLVSFAEPGELPQQTNCLDVSPEFFGTLNVVPALGRLFAPGDDQPGHDQFVILSHRLWSTRFGSDPNVLGREVRVNGETCSVIGVLPASFEAPLVWGPAEFVRPLTIHPSYPTERKNNWMQIMGRLKPGIGPEQANAELDAVAARLSQSFPEENVGKGLRVVDLHSANMDPVSRFILWLMPVLSTMVLVIACANLANLLLARSLGRSREFAIRAALGASRVQLMRPLLAESFVLALAGGAVGLLVAQWGATLLGRNIRINNDLGLTIPLDTHVLAFAGLSALISGLAFGLAPAWLASRSSTADSLKESSRGSTAGRAHHRLKYALIAGELAFALVLVGVAGNFALGSRGFLNRELGWKPDNVFSGFLVTPWNRYFEDEKLRTFQRDLIERLKTIPGVEFASITTALPVFSFNGTVNLTAEGQPVPNGQEPLALVGSVSSDYFSVAQIPLRRGMLFPADLRADSRPMVVVNEAVAQRFWSGEDPVGKRLRFKDDDKLAEVIGVVGDVRFAANLSDPTSRLQVYRSIVHAPPRYQTIAIRASVSPESITQAVRQAVAALDPDLPVANTGSVRSNVARGMANLNVIIANLAIFAGMGLLISVIGLYGVIAHLTAQRTRDIGVRIALGANFGHIVRMVLGQGLVLFLLGMAIGVPLFAFVRVLLGRSMPGMPFPGIWLPSATLLILGAATLLASWIPARRAARLDPLRALHAD